MVAQFVHRGYPRLAPKGRISSPGVKLKPDPAWCARAFCILPPVIRPESPPPDLDPLSSQGAGRAKSGLFQRVPTGRTQRGLDSQPLDSAKQGGGADACRSRGVGDVAVDDVER